MCDTRVIHSLYKHLIWCCSRRMLPVCSRGATLCDCVTVSFAVLVLKLTLRLHLRLSFEASKVCVTAQLCFLRLGCDDRV